jgi:hypothetical protein
MTPNNRNALDGVLSSGPPSILPEIKFRNQLDVPVRLYWLDGEGRQLAAGQGLSQGMIGQLLDIQPKTEVSLPNALSGHYLSVTASSGALVCALDAPKTVVTVHTIDAAMLTSPNDIGPFPAPSPSMLIPVDSPSVLVGCGVVAGGNIVTREQYWHRTSESFALAPKQTHTIGFSSTRGMQETTSEQSTVATSLGLSASAGWGPISASVSASLSATSTSFQQVTVTEETTHYETIVLSNPSDKTQYFLKWQLMDVVTVFDKGNQRTPLASIVLAQAPVLVGGPYLAP